MPNADLPRGIYVIYTDRYLPRGRYLAFDMGFLPNPRPDCLQPERPGRFSDCLIFFAKHESDSPYPKMVGWGSTYEQNIVTNPTRQDVEKLLLEEKVYKEERDAYEVIAVRHAERPLDRFAVWDDKGRSEQYIWKSIVILNREINSLYNQYFHFEVPSSEPPRLIDMLDDEGIFIDAQDSIASVAAPPTPSLFGWRDDGTHKQSRKLKRDINRLRRTIGRRRGYRQPLTETDKWNKFKDGEGFDDTSSDEEDTLSDEEHDIRSLVQELPKGKVLHEAQVIKWGDYSSEEGEGNRIRRRRRKKKKCKSKKCKSKKCKSKKCKSKQRKLKKKTRKTPNK
jgi:hypothetical protein